MPAQRKDRAISLRNRSAGAVRNVSAREVPVPPSARDTVGRLSARDVQIREGRNLLRPNLSEKKLPFLYTLHFNGHEIICRQDNLAASVES